MERDNTEQSPVLTARQEWVKRETARRLRRDMTAGEKCLWQHLRASRLGGLRFYRQQVIDGFIADFYCHTAALVVEVDGAVHDAQAEYDAERTEVFARRGLRTLRFTNTHVQSEIYGVMKAIRAAVRESL